MLEGLTVEDFAPLTGQAFAVTGSGVVLELTEAEALGPAPTSELRAPFRLRFHGPADAVLSQRIHRLEHDALGPLDLFVVPIGPDGRGMRYEVIFG